MRRRISDQRDASRLLTFGADTAMPCGLAGNRVAVSIQRDHLRSAGTADHDIPQHDGFAGHQNPCRRNLCARKDQRQAKHKKGQKTYHTPPMPQIGRGGVDLGQMKYPF